jgi:hypothetical protein
MKKLKLNFREALGNAQVLTRDQMKKVVGGVAGSSEDPHHCDSCTGFCTILEGPCYGYMGTCAPYGALCTCQRHECP